MAKPLAIHPRPIDQLGVISAALAIEFRCKLDFKSFEFNLVCS